MAFKKLPPSRRLECERLRKRGLSYSEITKKTGITKGTLSFWLKEVPLSEKHRKRLYTKQIEILSRGAQSQRERRLREINSIIEDAKKEISHPLSFETLRLIGAVMYWAEGSKSGDFKVTNSDPHFMCFMVHWMEQCFHVQPQDLHANLNIYEQQSDIQLKKFWSQITRIPLQNFGKSFVKPTSSGYKKNTLYYGTVNVRMPKGTDAIHRVHGWVQAILKDIIKQVQLSERRWGALRRVHRPVNIRSTRP